MKLKVLFLFVLTCAFCIFSPAQTPDQITPGTIEEMPRGYLLGPGDVVEVKVLTESDFNFTATVDENGNIEVPFFDKPLMAKCRSERELKADVSKLVSKYLRNPQINLQVERKSRPPATIYGEVRTPQQVTLTRKATLLELLSFSGGVTEDAGGMIQVFRTQPPMCSDNTQDGDWTDEKSGLDVPSRIYSLSSLRQGREEANPAIYPGDVIVVQKAAPVYITGEVRQPVGLHLKEGGLSLSQAMAMVGGVNREAKTKDIKIYRQRANSKDREVISVNYDLIKKGTQKDVMLEPYDIVEVDKAKKSIKDIVLGIILKTAESVPGVLPTRILY